MPAIALLHNIRSFGLEHRHKKAVVAAYPKHRFSQRSIAPTPDSRLKPYQSFRSYSQQAEAEFVSLDRCNE